MFKDRADWWAQYGQLMWFQNYHPEKVPSAVERYEKEVHRVTSLLDEHLKQQHESGASGADGPWMVGGKLSYADLVFLPWQCIIVGVLGKLGRWNEEKYPFVKEWMGRMMKREGIKRVMEIEQPFFGRKGGNH